MDALATPKPGTDPGFQNPGQTPVSRQNPGQTPISKIGVLSRFLVALAAGAHPLAFDRSARERADDLVGGGFGDFDRRELLADFDRADRVPGDIGFVRDGADDILGTHAALLAQGDDETGLCFAAALRWP